MTSVRHLNIGTGAQNVYFFAMEIDVSNSCFVTRLANISSVKADGAHINILAGIFPSSVG